MRRLRIRLGVAAMWAFAFLAVAECVARFAFGFGDPVLYVAHATIEYMLRPNQDVHRFGRHIVVNQYGMRSPPFVPHKSDARELRVLVIGDSVVNGGNLTDQSKLATSLLAQRLERETHRPVIVANASAGSWGPQNMLAWIRSYGLFEAESVVVVLSSHDAADVPTFSPLDDNTHPTRRPTLALQEAFTRYGLRYLTKGKPVEQAPTPESPRSEAIDAVRELFAVIRAAGATPALVQHVARSESNRASAPGYIAIAVVADESHVMRFDDGKAFAADPAAYRDDIHPSDRGQELLATQLFAAVTSSTSATDRTSALSGKAGNDVGRQTDFGLPSADSARAAVVVHE